MTDLLYAALTIQGTTIGFPQYTETIWKCRKYHLESTGGSTYPVFCNTILIGILRFKIERVLQS